MTDRNKFEAMLEALINEDHDAAKDIFHNIVVGKSREIYEKLLAEEFEEEEDDDADDAFGSDDEFGDEEGEDDDEEGEDDDFGGFGDDEEGDDEFGDDEFGDEEGDGDLEDRVLDLEDALDELKSEFEQLLAGEEDEPEHDDMFGGDDEIDGDDELGLGGNEFDAGEEENEFQSMFEYVNKVALPKHGDNGLNNKSLFNKDKYNDMGGVAPKFGGTAVGEGTGKGLLKPTTTRQDAGNVNVSGNKKAPKLKSVSKPTHGDNGTNTRSLIPGRK